MVWKDGNVIVEGSKRYSSFILANRTLTTPTEESWPGVDSLPDYKPIFPNWKTNTLAQSVKQLDEPGLDILKVGASPVLELIGKHYVLCFTLCLQQYPCSCFKKKVINHSLLTNDSFYIILPKFLRFINDSLLTNSLLFISIQFNDIVNNQSLVRRGPRTVKELYWQAGIFSGNLTRFGVREFRDSVPRFRIRASLSERRELSCLLV